MSTPWLAVMLLAVTSLAEFTAVRLRRGDEIEALTLLEAAMVADVLLLPPSVATIVAILGLALASALDRRRAIMKTVFNLGSHATGTALLVTIVSSTSKAGSGISGPMVAALLVGTLVFAALNLCLLSCVISAAGGPPARETIKDSWRLSLIMAVGTCGIGAVAVGVTNERPLSCCRSRYSRQPRSPTPIEPPRRKRRNANAAAGWWRLPRSSRDARR